MATLKVKARRPYWYVQFKDGSGKWKTKATKYRRNNPGELAEALQGRSGAGQAAESNLDPGQGRGNLPNNSSSESDQIADIGGLKIATSENIGVVFDIIERGGTINFAIRSMRCGDSNLMLSILA